LDDPLKGNYALQLKIIYGSNNVVVQTLQDTFTQFAHTANQKALTLALDSVSEDPSEAALIAYLNTVPGTNIQTQYELISPEELGAMYDTAIGAADATEQNLQRRMKDIRAGTADVNSGLSLLDQHGMKFDFDGTDFGRCDQKIDLMGNERITEPNSWNAFAAGNGEFVDVGTRGNAAGYTIHSSGITLGADHAVSDTLSWGLTAGYVGTRANLINNGTVQVDGGKFGAYATWYDEGCYLDAALGGGYNSYTTRRAALGGFAVGDTQGAEFDGLLGLGSDVNYDRWTFGPNGSLQYNIVSIDEFTESGSMAPLHILHNDSHSLRTQLGWHLAYDLDAGKFKVRPELGLAWQHEFLDTSRATTAQFATGAGTVFQVDSPEVGRDSLALTVGVNVRWSRRVSTFVAYDGQLGRENFLQHNVSVGVGVSF
jgi:outer membrane autotransporter protein